MFNTISNTIGMAVKVVLFLYQREGVCRRVLELSNKDLAV